MIHDLAQGWPGLQQPPSEPPALPASAPAPWWQGWWSRLLGRAGIYAGWH